MSKEEFFRKYRWWVATTVIFLLLITVLSQNNILDKIVLNRQIRELKTQRDYCLKHIKADSLLLDNLENNVFLERYAREKYFMKYKNETIYIIK